MKIDDFAEAYKETYRQQVIAFYGAMKPKEWTLFNDTVNDFVRNIKQNHYDIARVKP